MSRREAGERPDLNAVLDGLKPFQRDTVEYAFERLYQAADSTRRFLVADEVGLGKTLVARGVIAKAIDHLWAGDVRVEQIDIVYVCTNAQIARQNVRRLQIGGQFVQAARLGLLPREIHGLRNNRVNYLALTPGTSFDLRSSMGTAEERVVLYHLLQRVWPDSTKAPMNLLQGFVRRTDNFRWQLQDFERWAQLDEKLANAFIDRLREEGDGFRDRYDGLCRRFRQARPRIPWRDREPQIAFIGHLRSILAEVCVTALEPDLVILDEFQRFKGLLDGEGPAGELARRLFTYSDETSDVQLLLLSATPYRMYTVHHENAEDDHYRDFLRTVEFLEGETGGPSDLRPLLDEYRQAMYRIESETEPLQRIKARIERRLRRVMSRTERLGSSGEADGMLREVPATGIALTAEDVGDFLALEKIGREVEQPQVLDYWKSAPYVLSFMDDYRLKTDVADRLPLSSEDNLAQHLTSGGRVSPVMGRRAGLRAPRPRQRPTAEPARVVGAIRRLATPLGAAVSALLRRVGSLATSPRGEPLETSDLLDLAGGAQGDRDHGQLRRGAPRLSAIRFLDPEHPRGPPPEGAIVAVRILGRPPHRDARTRHPVSEPEPRWGGRPGARSGEREYAGLRRGLRAGGTRTRSRPAHEALS